MIFIMFFHAFVKCWLNDMYRTGVSRFAPYTLHFWRFAPKFVCALTQHLMKCLNLRVKQRFYYAQNSAPIFVKFYVYFLCKMESETAS